MDQYVTADIAWQRTVGQLDAGCAHQLTSAVRSQREMGGTRRVIHSRKVERQPLLVENHKNGHGVRARILSIGVEAKISFGQSALPLRVMLADLRDC